MASINIDDKWWIDIRRSALIRLLKDEEKADGAAVRLWRAGLEAWKNNREAIPKHCFELLPCASELLACALVELKGASYYVKGASHYFEWVHKKREAGQKGGKKSVESRRKKDGTAQPSSKQTRSSPEANSNQPEADSKQTSSSSNPLPLSLSLSLDKEIHIGRSDDTPDIEFDFESIYKRYPKRLGDQRKSAGFKRLAKEIKTEEDFEAFGKAVDNYAKHIRAIDKERTEFVKQFGTFVNQVWTEWIYPNGNSLNDRASMTKEELIKGGFIFSEEEQ